MRLRRRKTPKPAPPRRITLADLTPGTYVAAASGMFRIEAANLEAVQGLDPLTVTVNLTLRSIRKDTTP